MAARKSPPLLCGRSDRVAPKGMSIFFTPSQVIAQTFDVTARLQPRRALPSKFPNSLGPIHRGLNPQSEIRNRQSEIVVQRVFVIYSRAKTSRHRVCADGALMLFGVRFLRKGVAEMIRFSLAKHRDGRIVGLCSGTPQAIFKEREIPCADR